MLPCFLMITIQTLTHTVTLFALPHVAMMTTQNMVVGKTVRNKSEDAGVLKKWYMHAVRYVSL